MLPPQGRTGRHLSRHRPRGDHRTGEQPGREEAGRRHHDGPNAIRVPPHNCPRLAPRTTPAGGRTMDSVRFSTPPTVLFPLGCAPGLFWSGFRDLWEPAYIVERNPDARRRSSYPRRRSDRSTCAAPRSLQRRTNDGVAGQVDRPDVGQSPPVQSRPTVQRDRLIRHDRAVEDARRSKGGRAADLPEDIGGSRPHSVRHT